MRQYLKRLRTNKGLTQSDVAEALGLTQNYYSLIENGTRMKKMDLFLLDKISDFYDIPLSQLINEELAKERRS